MVNSNVAAVILLLSCIKIKSLSSNYFCLQFDQTSTWRLRCANGLQTCSFQLQQLMVQSYSYNPLWTMITTMFQEKSNMYHISGPIIREFFPKHVPLRSLSSSFIDSFSFAMKRCNTSQGFGAFFVQSCDRFLYPFYLCSYFSLSFLIKKK